MRLHGAAHGDGVYVAPLLGSSFGYVRLFGGRTAVAGQTSVAEHCEISCVAICEVANSENVKDCGWCKVIPDAELIVPRFLIVWDCLHQALPASAGTINSTDKAFDVWCRERMKYNGCGPSADDGASDDEGDGEERDEAGPPEAGPAPP